MGDYKRLISYIYSYEKGVKSKNSGFGKIESRNGICRINISVRISDILLNETEDNMLDVYLFNRKSGKVNKIFIGRIKIVSGCSIFKTQINSRNIDSEGTSISDITGIFICSKSFLDKKNNINIIYASEWDDIPIDVREFTQDAIITTDAADMAEEENENNVEVEKEEQFEAEEQQEQIEIDNVVFTVEKETEDCETCKKELEEILVAAENKSDSEKFFVELSGCYPKIKVEGIDGECIKITPHDISYLPKRYWHLSNNSFLLHGFYNYRYVLLCENTENNKKVYKICVPGVFHNKEQSVAKMFGFSDFKCNGQKEMMKFGYWCINL